MRVISGQYRGARLFAPKDRLIRPTTDRVREYIFSCIQHDIVDSTFADLFCGTGAVGIEAKSRGASKIVFVDVSTSSIDLLNRNLKKIGLEANVFKRSVESFLRSCNDSQQYDFIFCDPPYKYDHFETIFDLIKDQHLLRKDGQLLLESDARREAPKSDDFSIVRQKKWAKR